MVMPGTVSGSVFIIPISKNVTETVSNFAVTTNGVPRNQEGNKFIGAGADGNTALVGGYGDNSSVGAAWVFTRSSGVWSQQGSKLVGSGYTGAFIGQGSSVSLSADGNTAIVGRYQDNSGIGATWVFTRNSGVWIQQGTKLVGDGVIAASGQQGTAVNLSANGNTALVGGPNDNTNIGAAWIFTRSKGVWYSHRRLNLLKILDKDYVSIRYL